MPNYFVTNTARFNPFSYQELALPLMQATEAQYALEDVLSTVDDGTLETYLAGEDGKSPYRERYKSLTDRLQAASNELASRGLNPTLMREVRALRSDYNRFKTPVETAGKKKAALMDEYRKLKVSNPYLIGDDPGQKSLQYYIENPNYNPTYDNGKAYIEQGALIGSQLADQLRNPDAPYTIVPGSGGAFLRAVYRRGYTPEEIANDPMFVDITNGILKSKGIDPEADDDRTNAIRAYIQQGLFSSLGKDDVDMQKNPNFMTPLQQLQYKKAKRELDLLDNPTGDTGGYSTKYKDYNYTGKDRQWATKITNRVLRELSGVTSVDGSTVFNNTLEVKQYLDALNNLTARAFNKPGASGYGGDNPEYKQKKAFYESEKRRLAEFTISDKDYRDIKNRLGFRNDSFTYDDVVEAINSNRRDFGVASIPAYSIASIYDSKENFERYMGGLEENIDKIDDSNKSIFYTTKDGATLDKPISKSKVKDLLFGKDSKALRISGTVPLVHHKSGIQYAIINTSGDVDIAVPIGLFNDVSDVFEELRNVPYDILGDFSNPEDFYRGYMEENQLLNNATKVSKEVNRQNKER